MLPSRLHVTLAALACTDEAAEARAVAAVRGLEPELRAAAAGGGGVALRGLAMVQVPAHAECSSGARSAADVLQTTL